MASNASTEPREKRRGAAASEGAPRRRRTASKERKSAPDEVSARARVAARAEQRARRALTSGGALLLFGLAIVGVDSSDVGAGVTLLGLLILIFGIHSFGRLGPEEPALLPSARP